MRTSRYMWSERLNPAMWGIALIAPYIRKNRLEATPDDYLLEMQGKVSDLIVDGLEWANKANDKKEEEIFSQLYGHNDKTSRRKAI
jgi:hypothetical protein